MKNIRFIQKTVIIHPEIKDKFLILVRTLDDKSRPGDFDLPGGSVALDELHEDALKREVLEETSLEIENIKPVLVNTKIDNENNLYWIYIGYSSIAKTTEVKINEKEHSGFEWLTLDEFKQKAGDHILLQQIESAFATI